MEYYPDGNRSDDAWSGGEPLALQRTCLGEEESS